VHRFEELVDARELQRAHDELRESTKHRDGAKACRTGYRWRGWYESGREVPARAPGELSHGRARSVGALVALDVGVPELLVMDVRG